MLAIYICIVRSLREMFPLMSFIIIKPLQTRGTNGDPYPPSYLICFSIIVWLCTCTQDSNEFMSLSLGHLNQTYNHFTCFPQLAFQLDHQVLVWETKRCCLLGPQLTSWLLFSVNLFAFQPLPMFIINLVTSYVQCHTQSKERIRVLAWLTC